MHDVRDLNVRHPNRTGGLRTNYMMRKYLRKANPHKRRSIGFREVGCWYCIPGNRKKFLQALDISIREENRAASACASIA